jgi:hypothetical protein
MAFFVWSKMQTESGATLPAILALKENERLAGNGQFWWGVGNSLGPRLRKVVQEAGGTLPVLFSLMLSRPQKADTHPEGIHLWTKWEDAEGRRHDLPPNVLQWSRAGDKDYHYALVCHSQAPLAITAHGAFDPTRCVTPTGKRPGAQQTTALLQGDPYDDHGPGVYHFGFRATLIEPWQVKLVEPRKLTATEGKLFEEWKRGWTRFVARTRAGRDLT